MLCILQKLTYLVSFFFLMQCSLLDSFLDKSAAIIEDCTINEIADKLKENLIR